jgi:hypothetical protein
MRRVSKGAWAAITLASIASLLCVFSLTKLASAPRVVRALTPPREDVHRRLAVASSDGVLVVEADGAYRVGPDLRRHQLGWPQGVHIDAISSVSAGRNGGVALIFIQSGERRVLFLDGERAIAGKHADELPLAVHGGEIITRSADGLTRLPIDLASPPEPLPLDERIQLDAIEGITWIDGGPHLLVGERGAHWLIDLDGKVLPMPGGSFAVWSASMMFRSGHLPFLDEHGVAHAYESGVSWTSFTVEPNGELMALPIARGLDEAGVLATAYGGRRLELRATGRRLQASTTTQVAWQSIASTTGAYEFAAFPVGDRWMLLNEDGSEAVLIDGAGRPLHRSSVGATVAALSGLPLAAWMGLVGLLFGLLLFVPMLIARTAQALKLLDETAPRADQPDARGVFFGTLQLPPGSLVGAPMGRRVNLAQARLRASGLTIDLASGPRRLGQGAPFVDGDPVYVVGAVANDTAGGPMRATHRKALGPDGKLYFIGRGGPSDFERDLARFESFRLTVFALAQLGLSLAVLMALGLRPFA